MLNLSLKKLELKAKNRGITGYQCMSIYELLSILDDSDPVKKTKTIRDIYKKINTDKIPKSTGKLFRLEEYKDIKDRALGDIKTLFESDKGDYYK